MSHSAASFKLRAPRKLFCCLATILRQSNNHPVPFIIYALVLLTRRPELFRITLRTWKMPNLQHKQKDVVKEDWDLESDEELSKTETTVDERTTSPLLRLPKEIRLEIYALVCLPLKTRYVKSK